MAISVKAFITESGEIKADLPKDHLVGEVMLAIEPFAALDDTQMFQDMENLSPGQVIQRMMRTDIWHVYQNILNQLLGHEESTEKEITLAEAEFAELIRPEPKTGAEIAAGLERTPGGYNALIGFDDADMLGVSPDQLIAAMMRTSIWDVYQNIVKDCRE